MTARPFPRVGSSYKGTKSSSRRLGSSLFTARLHSGIKCNGPGEQTTPLSHVIWRYSDSIGDNANLLSGCVNENYGDAESNIGEGWYNAVYLGAVFQLNEGDKLWTETNRLTNVESEQGKNFFGVFAL
ncbi:unnamed protein product [Coregonus sp. 'balchen']|nr:unnamed protein product [Coregonus sp. 'balchen']